MERPKSVIYIPHWVKGIFERQNRPLSELLQFDKAKEVLSLSEMANILNLNGRRLWDAKFDPETGYPVYDGLSGGIADMGPDIADIWKKSATANRSADNSAALAVIENATLFSYGKACDNELNVRLFALESKEDHLQLPFITYDIESDVALVVVYPGFFNAKLYPAIKYDLLVGVLKVLYVYNTYASVCKTPYFRKYLESMV